MEQFAKEEDFEFREHSSKVRFKMIKHVIWDWNGTLIDDAQLCVSIVNEILSDNMLSEVDVGGRPWRTDMYTFVGEISPTNQAALERPSSQVW